MQDTERGGAASCRVLAYDERRRKYLGAIADLTPDRLVLLSEKPLQADQIVELRLECSDQQPGLDGVVFGTRVMWSDIQAGTFWAGMRIISMDQDVRQRLTQMRTMADLETFDSNSLTA